MNDHRSTSLNKQLPVLPNSPLPPLYAAWMDDLFAAPIPSESDATCDDCAMCAGSDAEKEASGAFFNPQVKCCSYVPELPNFLVGGVLADTSSTSEAGRASMAKRLEAGIAVTPLALVSPSRSRLSMSAPGLLRLGKAIL
jgi:hypothetical protein